MKRSLLMASALGLALQVASTGRALAVEPPNGGEHHEGHHRMAPGARMDAMAERLKLTPEQRKTVEAAFRDRMAKMKALQDDFAAKRKAIVDASNSKIEAGLNADQKAEFAKMKEEMQKEREDFRNRRHDHEEHSEDSDGK